MEIHWLIDVKTLIFSVIWPNTLTFFHVFSLSLHSLQNSVSLLQGSIEILNSNWPTRWGHWIILSSLHCYQPIRGEPECTYFRCLMCGSVTSLKPEKEPLPAMSLPCLHSSRFFFSLMPSFTASTLPPNWGQWTWHHPKGLPYIWIIVC